MTEPKTRLGEILRIYLAVNQLTLRPVAKEIGINASTLMRITHGKQMDGETMVKLLAWMMERV